MFDLLHKVLTRGYFHSKNDGDDNNSNSSCKNMDQFENFTSSPKGIGATEVAATAATTTTNANVEGEEDPLQLVQQMKRHKKQWNSRPMLSSENEACQLLMKTSSSSTVKTTTATRNQIEKNDITIMGDDSNASHKQSSTIPASILTKEKLAKEIEQFLNNESKYGREGIISISNAAKLFQVAQIDIKRAVAVAQASTTTNSTMNRDDAKEEEEEATKIYQIGTDILSETYVYDSILHILHSNLPLSGGRMSTSDIISNILPAPIVLDETNIFRRMVEEQLNAIVISSSTSINGNNDDDVVFMWAKGKREIVTKEYVRRLKCEVRGVMGGLTVPTPLESLVPEYGWDLTLLTEQVQSMCLDCTLPGELHGSIGVGGVRVSGDNTASTASSLTTQRDSYSSTTATPTLQTAAIYIPNIYTFMQRKSVHDFFKTNGYITVKTCRSMGISDGRIGDYVSKLFPKAICLSSAIINSDIIVSLIESAVQESILSNTFVDLKMHLPEALWADKDDVSKILYDFVLPNLTEERSGASIGKSLADGVDVIYGEEALYFSSGMVRCIRETILPPLVETYGKSRAKEIDFAMSEVKKQKSSSSCHEEGELTPAKGGKSKKSKKQPTRGKRLSKKTVPAVSFTERDLSSTAGYASGVVPLCQVAKRIAEKYPDLSGIQDAHGGLVDDANEECLPQWENDDVSSGRENVEDGGEGPLYEFCRRALYTLKFQDACDRAVQAELDKIISTKQGLVSSRTDGASRVRSIEDAFEDPSCFAAACQQVQMFAKSVLALSSCCDNSEIAARLEHDFLTGCAANFARRITEYCLFKNDVGGGIFIFGPDKESSSDQKREDHSVLPSFCLPVDVATRSFNNVYLSCTPAADGKSRDPLSLLRQEFPGSVGIGLARMWMLCGGECYLGGKKTSGDGNELFQKGNLKGFLCHVEESCLSICGLPFKILDKKGEKQVMFARKKSLKHALQLACEGKDVVNLSILLIFQQVKHLAIYNSDYTNDILDMLSTEKRISHDIFLKLKELQDSLQQTKEVPDGLIEKVRTFGLSKDISKHIME